MPDLKLAGELRPAASPFNWFAPFSGSVTQAINPWSWNYDNAVGQVGLVNINMGHSSNPQLEQRILDEVGSYGRQLGRIGEALEVLLDQVKLGRLDAGQKAALDDFRFQMAEVKRLKAKAPPVNG
ncbi:MAG: hypothetical protein JWP41_320 [Ramlibacter sp.]|jgi:hypothetical protein|nr:hypothetical protein [Ramlibacter sp.]